MPTAQLFTLHPLSRALKLLSITPFLLISEMGQARVLNPGEILAIDGTTVSDKYVLNDASTLNAKGAQTRDITVNNSTLNLDGSTVQATSANGVHLNAGTANITRSNISSDRTGLIVSRNAAGTQVSTAIVSDSVITGVTSGVTVNGTSTLTLTGSTVTGTGTNSAGLRLFNGSATVRDSAITGNKMGIEIVPDSGLDAPSTLNLDHTDVQGVNGSAIVVDTLGIGAAKANIAVLNGSTLSASNGILMDVRNGAEGNLRVGSGNLVGDIVADGTSTANVLLEDSATLTGRLQNVQNLGVNSNARWVMIGDGEVQNLVMNGGAIQFGNPGEFFKLNVGTLAGSGGTFHMHTDFNTGEVDTLTVAGTATGNHTVAIDSMGTEPMGDGSTAVIKIGSGDATFTLAGGAVDLGAFSYNLDQLNNTEWHLNVLTRTVSPGTQSVIALFNAAPTAWYGELSTLRTRMGEVRMDHGKAGGWIRAYGNKFDVDASSGVAYQQVQRGLSFGADAPLPMGDGQWLVGLLGGYSKSDLDLSGGTSGTIDSYYLGAYSAYGHRQDESSVSSALGFNGELLEKRTGYYFLGNGHRAYSPSLMRFYSPDVFSPFEEGGVNAYAYCGGNPADYVDPTGTVYGFGWISKLATRITKVFSRTKPAPKMGGHMKSSYIPEYHKAGFRPLPKYDGQRLKLSTQASQGTSDSGSSWSSMGHQRARDSLDSFDSALFGSKAPSTTGSVRSALKGFDSLDDVNASRRASIENHVYETIGEVRAPKTSVPKAPMKKTPAKAPTADVHAERRAQRLQNAKLAEQKMKDIRARDGKRL